MDRNEIIFETSFSVEDMIGCMDEELRKKFDSLPEEKQTELVEKHIRLVGKGLEAGLMDDWSYIMSCAISASGLEDNINKE